MKTIYTILAVLIFTACGSSGGGAGGTTSTAKTMFNSDFTKVDDVNQTLSTRGYYFGWKEAWVNPNFPNCNYEFQVNAVLGNTNAFTINTVDVTTPADPTCFDYSVSDEIYTWDGTFLTKCELNDPTNCQIFN
jgi:hypothetical protein